METRPLSNGVEILTPKERTQLQGIKRRQKGYSGLSKSEATKLLKEEVNRAWEIEYNLAKTRQTPRPSNYFQTYEWLPNYSIKAKCKRAVSSAYYTLRLGHGYLKRT
jgi:hypothetical protein